MAQPAGGATAPQQLGRGSFLGRGSSVLSPPAVPPCRQLSVCSWGKSGPDPLLPPGEQPLALGLSPHKSHSAPTSCPWNAAPSAPSTQLSLESLCPAPGLLHANNRGANPHRQGGLCARYQSGRESDACWREQAPTCSRFPPAHTLSPACQPTLGVWFWLPPPLAQRSCQQIGEAGHSQTGVISTCGRAATTGTASRPGCKPLGDGVVNQLPPAHHRCYRRA